MANNKRQILIELLGDATGFKKAAGDAGGATGKLDKASRTLGKTLLSVYAVKKIINFGLAAVHAAEEDAAAQQVLATTMRNTIDATDGQIASLEKWITQISYATGYLDDDLRPAMGIFLRATKDQTKAQDLMQLSMDVARGTGKDLASVTAAIAKAYGGNTTALGRLIPGIKQAGEGTLTWATAQARLNQQFGGQAAAYADTAAGKAARLSAQYQDMKEAIGTALIPVMQTFVGILSTVFGWFNSLSPEVQRLVVALTVGAAVAYVASAAIGALNAAMASLKISAEVSQPWLLGISLALGAIVAASAMFQDETVKADTTAQKFSDTIKAGAGSLDLQRVAFLDAAGAAAIYRDTLFSGITKEVHDKIAGDKEMQAAMDKYGITMEEITAIVTGAGDAQHTYKKLHQDASYAIKQGTDEQMAGGRKLENMLSDYAVSAIDVIDTNVRMAKSGDVLSIMFLKASGNWGRLTADEQKAAEATLDAAAATDKASAATAAAAETNNAFAAAIEGTNYATRDAAAALSDEADKARDLKAAIDAVFSPYMDLEEAQRNLAQAAQDTTTAIKENGTTLDNATDKGRANRETIEKQVKSILDLGVSMVATGQSTDTAAAYVNALTGQLHDQLIAAGLTEDQVNSYLAALGMTPANVKTSMELANYDTTKRKLEDQLKQLGEIDDGAKAEITAAIESGSFVTAQSKIDALAKDRGINLKVSLSGGGVIHVSPIGAKNGIVVTPYAAGGHPNAGDTIMVGEDGPEVMQIGRHATVHPANVSAQLLGASRSTGSGGQPIHVTIHVAGSVIAERDLQDIVAAGVRTASRRQGRNVLAPRKVLV